MTCWRSAGVASLPPSKDSPFDREVLEAYDQAATKSQPGTGSPPEQKYRRRRIEGQFGGFLQFMGDQLTSEKLGVHLSQNVVEAVDPEALNFMKAEGWPKLTLIDVDVVGQESPVPVTVLAHGVPLARGHVVLVPHCEQRLPQVLTEDLLLCGLSLLAQSTRHDFRLLFDSLAGSETLNHFHFHGVYVDQFSLPQSKFPAEHVERFFVAGNLSEGNVAVESLAEGRWWAKCFVVSAGCKEGSNDSDPKGDIEAIASVAMKLVAFLQERSIPHNLLLAPPQSVRMARREACVPGGEADIDPRGVLTPQVYIFPRRPPEFMSKLAQGAGCFAGSFDFAGLARVVHEQAYEIITEDHMKALYGRELGPEINAFDDLLCKAAWLVN